jgi:pimeloyl-ACP methyl ester carboxylesterase
MLFSHRQITLNDLHIHVVEGGDPAGPPILFLHGYPENWMAFEDLMLHFKEKNRVLAIDLPGIGLSQGQMAGDKRSIGSVIDQLLGLLQLEKITLVGHDVGGMITWSMLRYFPQHLSAAVIVGTAIPGVDPWEEVKRNPYIWHFAFYAVPQLPETLAEGRTRPLFDYFYNTLCYNKKAITEKKRREYVEAYQRPDSLTTGFNWYRAFPKDEKDNAQPSTIAIALLYVRGEKDFGQMGDYAHGLEKIGVQHLSTEVISGSGHFVPEENPGDLARVIGRLSYLC